MTPVAERGLNPAYYTFSERGTVRPLIGNVPVGMASPTGARDTYEPGHGEAYELPLGGTVHKAA
jgi:hypothetical protein